MVKKIQIEIRSVMFIDIVNYTKTTTQLSRESFDALHDLFDNLSIPTFEQFSGKVIKKIGDAFLITFNSVTDAVHCGIELQKKFQDYNFKHELNPKLQIRVAIHSGEVLIRNDDVYGDTVNTAARIEGVAGAGDIVFSESVYSTMNKNEFKVVPLGPRQFKGLSRPINVYKVRTKMDDIREKEIRRKRFIIKIKNKIKNFLGFILLMGILGLILYIGYFYLQNYFLF